MKDNPVIVSVGGRLPSGLYVLDESECPVHRHVTANPLNTSIVGKGKVVRA
jgi:hypothetical protein